MGGWTIYKIPKSGYAIIRKGPWGSTVSFMNGLFYVPFFQTIEEIKISITTVEIELKKSQGIKSKDKKDVAAILRVDFAVQNTQQDLCMASAKYGAGLLNDEERLSRFLAPKVIEYTKVVFANFDYDFLTNPEHGLNVKEELVQVMGLHWDGLVLQYLNIEMKC